MPPNILRMLLASLFAAVSTLATGASLSTEQVMPTGKCAPAYQKYLKASGPKAFAFGRNDNTGASRCGWRTKQKSVEAARKSALNGCQKKRTVTCHIVDENGTWLATDSQFKALVPPPDHQLTAAQRQAVKQKADKLLFKSCARLFDKYLERPGHKSFAYALDTRGRYACGQGTRRWSGDLADAKAIAACKTSQAKKKTKRKPVTDCRVVARGSELVAGLKDFGIDQAPPARVHLSRGEFQTFMRRTAAVLPARCHGRMKNYARSNGFKAVYAALDRTGDGVCGSATGAFAKAAATTDARTKCEANRQKDNVTAPCKQVIDGNTIQATPADIGITKPTDTLKFAISNGAVLLARRAIEQGAPVDTKSAEGYTALLLATRAGTWDDYQFMMQQGADPTIKGADGTNLAMMAALSGNAQILRDALARGVSPNEPGPKGNTAAHLAAMRLNLYLLGVLQDANADLGITNDEQKSALDLLEALNLNETHITERRTLARAVRANDINGIEHYLADTEPADAAEQFNELMASLALLNLKPATISHLLKRGADPNYRSKDGMTPLIQAAAINDEEMVNILLDAGADKAARDNKGRLALDRAKSETVKALLR